MGTCKIALELYQYTSVDDCARIRVLALFNETVRTDGIECVRALMVG